MTPNQVLRKIYELDTRRDYEMIETALNTHMPFWSALPIDINTFFYAADVKKIGYRTATLILTAGQPFQSDISFYKSFIEQCVGHFGDISFRDFRDGSSVSYW